MEEEKGTISFDATIFNPGRVTIPKTTRIIHDLKPGTKVKVILIKVEE